MGQDGDQITFSEGSGPQVVRFAPEELTVSPEQVARYAGGHGWRAGGEMSAAVLESIDLAAGLISPEMVYAVHPAERLLGDGALLLKNGLSVVLPPHERDPETRFLTAAVGTLGSGLEKRCRELAKDGDLLKSIFLDAAGVALLDALGEKGYALISEAAKAEGLFTGCRFAPGYTGMDISAQALLFQLVDGALIGIRLNSKMVMVPNKSVSFFVRFMGKKTAAKDQDKCRRCPVKECRFRGGLKQTVEQDFLPGPRNP